MNDKMRELVEVWENTSYDMTEEQMMAWAEQAADAMQKAITDPKETLDPKPWVNGSMRLGVRVAGHEWVWGPRPEYAQAMNVYPKEYFA